jgi:flagellar biosynthesis/type III secretory pathway protein FliH
MVIFYPILKKRLMEQGRKEGREEGREEVQEAWEAWNKRREEARANNKPFDEPPPSRREQNTTP